MQLQRAGEAAWKVDVGAPVRAGASARASWRLCTRCTCDLVPCAPGVIDWREPCAQLRAPSGWCAVRSVWTA